MFCVRMKSISSKTVLFSRLYLSPFATNTFITGANRLFLMMYRL